MKPRKIRKVRKRAPGGGRKRLGGQGGPLASRATISLKPGEARAIAALDPTGKNKLSRGIRFLHTFWLANHLAELPPNH